MVNVFFLSLLLLGILRSETVVTVKIIHTTERNNSKTATAAMHAYRVLSKAIGK